MKFCETSETSHLPYWIFWAWWFQQPAIFVSPFYAWKIWKQCSWKKTGLVWKGLYCKLHSSFLSWFELKIWVVSICPPTQDGRIVVKACEGLMLLVSLPEPAAAKCLTENTELCELLTDRLVSFYKALPQSMDPLDIETVESVNWG